MDPLMNINILPIEHIYTYYYPGYSRFWTADSSDGNLDSQCVTLEELDFSPTEEKLGCILCLVRNINISRKMCSYLAHL